MRKRFVIVGIIVWAGLVAGAQPLQTWVRAHWEDLARSDPAQVAARFASDAGQAVLGSPWAGFYYGAEAIERFWATFFAALGGVEELRPLMEPKAIPEANLAYAKVELRTARGPVVLHHYHTFDEEGRIRAADYAVVGLEVGGPVVDGTISEGEYERTVQEARSGVVFSWRNGLVVLFGALRSPGTGWVSVGFDPMNRMQGANFIIAAVTPAGLVIEDHFGTSPTSHRRDRRGDILEAAGTRVDGGTLVEFVIPLDSKDPEDKPLVPGKTYTVLLAHHRSSASFTVQHTARGSASITLEN